MQHGITSVLRRDAGAALDVVTHRVQRRPDVVGRALEDQALSRARAYLVAPEQLEQVLHQPGFSEPGLAADHEQLAVTGLRVCKPAGDAPGLTLPPHQGDVRPPAVQRREAAANMAFPQHLPQLGGLLEAFEVKQAQVTVQEQVTELVPGRIRNHHRVGLGFGLGTRCQIGGFTNRAEFGKPPAGTNELANHRQASRNPDAHLRGLPAYCRQARNCINDAQCRAHSLLAGILTGFRVAEIGQHAIAEVLGDPACVFLNHRRNCGTVAIQKFTQVLGIDAHGQGGGTHQVAEDHRDLPPLHGRWGGDGSRSGWRDGLGTDRHRCGWGKG